MAGIGRSEYEAEVWYKDVVDLMVREGLTFSAACQALGIKFTSAIEEHKHERRKSFQRMYTAYSNAYFEEIGTDPSLTKGVAIGWGMKSLQRLYEKGDDDKVSALLKTISDIAGWTKEGTEVTIVGQMSQAELEELKAKARALTQMAKEQLKDGKVN